MILPQWTEKYNKIDGGRDHLAYLNAGISMMEVLVPGVSTITQRARYYSFFPWLINRFFKSKEKKTYKNFQRYLKLKSINFLFANGLLYKDTSGVGVDGIDTVRNVINENEPKNYKWDELYIKKFRDNYGVYSRKLYQMGIVEQNKNIDVESLTKGKGVPLAEAFEKSIIKTRYNKEYCDIKEETVPAKVLEEFGKACGVLELDSHADEQELLTNIFFATDSTDNKDTLLHYINSGNGSSATRRESLLLHLDIFWQCNKQKINYDRFREIIYYSYLGGEGYKIKPTLKHCLEFWRLFFVRQYLIHAIETIFCGVTSVLYQKNMDLQEMMNRLLNKDLLQYLKKHYGIVCTYEMSMNDLLVLVDKIGNTDSNGFASLKSTICEENLYQDIRKEIKNPEATHYIGSALLTIFVIFLRFKDYMKPNNSYWEFSKIGGLTYNSTDLFYKYFIEKLNSNCSVGEFLASVIQDLIMKRHLYVATVKLARDKRDSFHFYYDNGFYRGSIIIDPKINTPRFRNITNILSDLGLIKSEDDMHSLTTRGKALLNKYV